jgi:hypothetical protein
MNLGAYGGTPEAGMSLSTVGNPVDLNNDDTVDAMDLHVLTHQWLKVHTPLIEDINRDGVVNLPDLALLIDDWLYRR